MKNTVINTPIRALVMLAWGLFALILTTQSDNVPLVHLMTSTIGSSEVGATVGHAALFGILTLVIYGTVVIWLSRSAALMVSMLTTLMLGPITEWSQSGLFGRTASLPDLLADWLGIFVVGFAVALVTQLRSQRQLQS